MDYHADGTKYDSNCGCEEVCTANLKAADDQIRESAAKDLTVDELFDRQVAVDVATDAVEKAALRSIQAAHYVRDEDPNAAAEREYAQEQLALAARDLVQAVEQLPPDKRPVGWTVKFCNWCSTPTAPDPQAHPGGHPRHQQP